VTFKTGFSPSGLGEGAVWSGELTFSGSEYDGSVAPLTALMVHLPAGVGGTSAGFPVCAQATLEADGPAGCPAGSMAGPQGSIGLEGKIGPDDIHEIGIIQPFFAPGEQLLFYIQAESPLDIEVIATGGYVTDTSPYGRVLTLELPLIEAVPGAPYVSTTALTLHLGASREEHGTVIPSVTVPSVCPSSGFPWAADTLFYESGAQLDVFYTGPCPGSEGLVSSQPGGSTGSTGAGGTSPPVVIGAAPPPSSPAHTVKPLTRAQQLAKALKICRRKKPHSKRKACEAQAKKRYKVHGRQNRKAKKG
jgi:hypothetical protein